MHFSSFLLVSLAGLSIAAPRPAAGNLDRREPILGNLLGGLSGSGSSSSNGGQGSSSNGGQGPPLRSLLGSILGAKRDTTAMEYPVDRMTAKDREGMTALLQSQLDQVERGSDPEYERITSPEKKEADKAALKEKIAQLQVV